MIFGSPASCRLRVAAAGRALPEAKRRCRSAVPRIAVERKDGAELTLWGETMP
jgi:hypothetical protein